MGAAGPRLVALAAPSPHVDTRSVRANLLGTVQRALQPEPSAVWLRQAS